MRRARAAVLVLVAFVISVTLSVSQLLQADELRFYDTVSRLHPRAGGVARWPKDMVAVRIDGEAADRFGRWPWPRALMGRFLDRARELGARTVVLDFYAHGATTLANDAAYRDSLSRARVVLAVETGTGSATSNGAFAARLLPIEVAEPVTDPARLGPPEPSFVEVASGVGHTWFPLEEDGSVRTQPPLIGVGQGKALPSLALAGMLVHEGLDPRALRWAPKQLTLPDGRTRALVHGRQPLDLWDPHDVPPTISAAAILDTAHAPAVSLAGALVLVYLDDPSIDRKMFGTRGEVAGGMLTLYAIRALRQGSAWSVVTLLPLAPFLLLAGLLLAFGGESPATVGRRAGLALLAWPGIAAASFTFGNVMIPVAPPLLFLAIVGIGGVALRAARVSARADAANAPRGKVAIVFTDVQSSTRLWEASPAAMRQALTMHHAEIRRALRAAGGYEVKTEGDAFMLAFPTVVAAAAWCVSTQTRLLDLPWPEPLLMRPEAAEVRDARGRRIFRGLRVRMGMHVGEPEAHVDPLTGRMDYLGSAVNLASRVANAARGGQILLSAAAWAELRDHMAELPPAVARELGEVPLKGFSLPERITELLPSEAEARFADVTSRV
ncbi:MAG TPA: CHASE2 domain-containing protein [bacterium]|nr:CHASE2 domain-containing protein [bacterium]